MNNAKLILENGQVYTGEMWGYQQESVSLGELVFNTGMTGYQEVLTDPSYAGQIITFTYPEIGNYGINDDDYQSHSKKSFVKGLVVNNYSPIVSNYRATMSLQDYLDNNKITAIQNIDTRQITRLLRDKGSMRAGIFHADIADNIAIEQVLKSPNMAGQNLLNIVSTPSKYNYPEQLSKVSSDSPRNIIVLDYGLKQNMLDIFAQKNCNCIVMPASTTIEEIHKVSQEYNTKHIFLTNGPGDPASCTEQIQIIKSLLESQEFIIFGVCLGHQLLASALGCNTNKLTFGHRGNNHPVIDLDTQKVLITSQNHGFAVTDNENLASNNNICITHKSLNDNTVEGISSTKYNAFSVQFHPEACPGPHDAEYLFDKFLNYN